MEKRLRKKKGKKRRLKVRRSLMEKRLRKKKGKKRRLKVRRSLMEKRLKLKLILRRLEGRMHILKLAVIFRLRS